MDRIRKPGGIAGRRVVLLAAMTLAVPFAGCTYLHGFGAGAPPRVGGMAGPAADPYLTHHRGGQSPASPGPEAALAKADGAAFVRSTDRSTSAGTEAGIVPTEVVSLGAPVALPTADHPRPGPPPAAVAERDDARSVVARARTALDAMATYQVQINRQERVGGVLQPAEDVQLSVRRSPKAVRLEWPTGPHKGREAIYSASEPGAMLHVHMGDSPIPVPNLSIPPDSPMVMKNSRHPITEAGFDGLIVTLERGVSGRPDGSSTAYLGLETPAPVGRPCHKIERHNAAGETWLFYLDAQTALPAMVQGTSASGELLERYRFRDVKADPPGLASADAFDPARRWGGGGSGLLGRLAQAAGGSAKTTDSPAPR